jgi:hypothetical protein
MRWWARASHATDFQLIVTPDLVQFAGGMADNFIRQIHTQPDAHFIQKVPMWYGETIGFWDGETLVTWTATVQGWGQHTMFEFSNALETIEIWTPKYDESHKLIGLDQEAILYDPEALVQPVRLFEHVVKSGTMRDPGQSWYYNRCLTNVRNVNGKPTQLGRGDPGFVDYYGRPWAQVWEEYFEKGWDKPDDNALPDDVGDIFK